MRPWPQRGISSSYLMSFKIYFLNCIIKEVKVNEAFFQIKLISERILVPPFYSFFWGGVQSSKIIPTV